MNTNTNTKTHTNATKLEEERYFKNATTNSFQAPGMDWQSTEYNPKEWYKKKGF